LFLFVFANPDHLLPVSFSMKRKYLSYIFVSAIFAFSSLAATSGAELPSQLKIVRPDSLKENQILYNGRVWHNEYSLIKGDQFLFSKEFLPATLSMNGKFYNNLNLSYDIYSDEIITPTNNGAILQLNKEMVDSFSLVSEGKKYRFINTDADSLESIKGYVQVLYKGSKSALYIKYKKEIQLLAVDDKYDLFYQTYRVYFLNGKTAHPISIKSDIIRQMEEYKPQIKEFIKRNHLSFSKKYPESFVPVIRYYDSLSK
jgi:hypothetical protein